MHCLVLSCLVLYCVLFYSILFYSTALDQYDYRIRRDSVSFSQHQMAWQRYINQMDSLYKGRLLVSQVDPQIHRLADGQFDSHLVDYKIHREIFGYLWDEARSFRNSLEGEGSLGRPRLWRYTNKDNSTSHQHTIHHPSIASADLKAVRVIGRSRQYFPDLDDSYADILRIQIHVVRFDGSCCW